MQKILAVIFILAIGTLFSCSSIMPGANSKKKEQLFQEGLTAYRSGNFSSAKSHLENAIRIDSTYIEAYLLLSDVAAELQDDDLRLKALEKSIELEPAKYKMAHKYLSDIYVQRGQFSTAATHLTKYLNGYRGIDSLQLHYQLQQIEKSKLLIDNELKNTDIEVFDTTINTENDEYWPFPSADDSTIYFTRLLQPDSGHPFERLFYSKRTENGWQTAQQLSIGDVQEVNEGTISMTANENLLFFTACGRSDGFGSCDIFYMFKNKGQWFGPVNAGENVNTAFWDAQPSVSATGDLLFWTSNRGGTIGKQDLWYCTIKRNKAGYPEFGEALNAGTGVNTTENDFSPFIHADKQTLYFASTGHYGMGKNDLFVSRLDSGQWGRARNIGYPINSIHDDDGLVVSPTAHLALFSSNRTTSVRQSKDLYHFNIPADAKPNTMGYLKGYVFNSVTHEKINAQVELSKLTTTEKQVIECDKEKGYLTVIEAGYTYALNATMPGFLFYSRHFDYKNPETFSNATIENIFLEPIKLDATVILNNIFFEFDSYEINPKSEAELMKVVEFMTLNSSVKIEVSGHTDTVGNEQYNLQLSEKRAKSIALYLSKHIEASRIEHVGYGAQKPVANNDTEEGRSKNRRSELKIIAY